MENAPVSMPSVPAVGARTRCTYHKRMHPATAEDRLAGSRLTSDATDTGAHAASDGIAFTGEAFGRRRLSGRAASNPPQRGLVADRDTANSN